MQVCGSMSGNSFLWVFLISKEEWNFCIFGWHGYLFQTKTFFLSFLLTWCLSRIFHIFLLLLWRESILYSTNIFLFLHSPCFLVEINLERVARWSSYLWVEWWKGMFLLTSSVEVEAYFWWVLVELDQVSMKSISQRVTAFDKAQCKYKQHMCKGFLM